MFLCNGRKLCMCVCARQIEREREKESLERRRTRRYIRKMKYTSNRNLVTKELVYVENRTYLPLGTVFTVVNGQPIRIDL